MFNVSQLQQLIGRPALLADSTARSTSVSTLSVQVIILDVRTCWNRVDCRVRPVAGSGEQWVAADRLSEIKPVDWSATIKRVNRAEYADFVRGAHGAQRQLAQ